MVATVRRSDFGEVTAVDKIHQKLDTEVRLPHYFPLVDQSVLLTKLRGCLTRSVADFCKCFGSHSGVFKKSLSIALDIDPVAFLTQKYARAATVRRARSTLKHEIASHTRALKDQQLPDFDRGHTSFGRFRVAASQTRHRCPKTMLHKHTQKTHPQCEYISQPSKWP